MASDEPPNPMAESGVTIRSDSEQYSNHEELVTSPPSSSSPAVILYQPPTIWSILRGAAINLLLPFVNGMMLGFGELFAHEAAFRLGWSNTRVHLPTTAPLPTAVQDASQQRRPPIQPGLGVRKDSDTALRENGGALNGSYTTRRIGRPVAVTAASQQLVFSLRKARNASTQSTTPPVPDASTLADVTGTPVKLTGSDLLDIPEQIGFLKTLGLEYGWGPSSVLQSLLESIYIYTGLPWWASIAILAVGVRLALFKPALDASENAQKYQELLKDPKYTAATEEVKRMLVTGNHLAGAEARAKVSLMNKAAGYSMWKSVLPMIQIPITFCMFRIIRGMSSLPVPSFETGGLLWFTDLTVSDPLFILPIATGLLVMLGIRIPLPYMAPQQQKIMKIMSLVVMPISTAVSLFFPAGLTWYFFVTSLLHTAQTWFLHQPWFRRLARLKPLSIDLGPTGGSWQAPRVVDISAPRVTPIQRAATPRSESIVGSIKSTLADAKEKLNERSDKASLERTHKAAREYEEKRALEEKERILARLERKRLKDEQY
ncbi:TOM13-domain-containing protein [Parathielavia appendiculata]|uniref:TOM13-domain-containing protein n=1 Tax=Parathielavia appendiculata TaxID=2587402 RepID=A0AAN6TRG8_9PEZI|nr:TOM13-domain-containing protein [Parathielavia appendiculata]